MRRSSIICLTLLLSFQSQTKAGIVTFLPDTPGSDVVHITDLPARVSYDVFIKPETIGPLIDSLDILIGSNDVAFGNEDWQYAPGFECSNVYCNPPQVGYYEHETYVGGFRRNLDTSGPLGLHFGTLTIAYPPPGVQPAIGVYSFEVNSAFDFGLSMIARSATTEPLFGQGVLHVIPEPATLWILAIGGGAMAMRRRATARPSAELDPRR